MAVNSLRYRPNATTPEETKAGYVVYAGTAYEYHHWSFRTEMKMAVAKEEDMPRTASQIVESLRGEALSIAITIGITTLVKGDGSGIKELIAAVRDYIFPVKEEEAKALYREGHKIGGVLSRQPGEPMQSYITRRKRWWTLLKELDPTVSLTEDLRGDMLLDNAGLSELDKRMILTSTANKTTQSLVEPALLKQHGKKVYDSKPSHDSGRKPFRKPFFKKRVANVSYWDYDADEGEYEDDEPVVDDGPEGDIDDGRDDGGIHVDDEI